MDIRCDPEVDVLYTALLRVKIERAEAAVAEGNVLSHEEVVKRSQQWFEETHPVRPRTPADS